MKITLFNPNSTASMTEKVAEAARRVSAPGTLIAARTNPMGPVSIEGYYDEAMALPGLMGEIALAEREGADAMIIACFDDTGLDAARALCDRPVLGLCESGVTMASLIAARFSVVTTLERSRIPIEALVARYGMASRCAVRAADIPVLSLEDPASGAHDRLRREIAAALSEDRAEAIVLGCAGMTDLAAALQEEFSRPVIDGVASAVKLAEALVGLGLTTAKSGPYARPIAKDYLGLMSGFAPQTLRRGL